jgi:hypothetical protein
MPLQKRAGRRTTDPHVVGETPDEDVHGAGSNLPVVAGPLLHTEELATGAVEAQLIGQANQKRGLRGGQPVLDQARSAYLGAEWSGANDRRPRRGLFTKTEI